MQRLEVSGAVRPIYGSLGVRRLIIMILDQTRGLSRPLHRVTSLGGPSRAVYIFIRHTYQSAN